MRSDGERDRWEIAAPAAAKSAAARRPGGPARPLQKGACPHNDLAPRVRGQSKQWLTDWHRKLVVLQVNSNALWAIWPRFFNSRLCAKWSPSLDRRTLRDAETPPPLPVAPSSAFAAR